MEEQAASDGIIKLSGYIKTNEKAHQKSHFPFQYFVFTHIKCVLSWEMFALNYFQTLIPFN